MSRFLLLFKQQMIHNSKLMLFSSVGFCGVVYIILVFAQLSRDLEPLDTEVFLNSLLIFFIIFGILYTGHSFPAFRNKENTITYLTLPASVFEKFLFEFINRILVMLIALPLLFWLTFNLEGYTFELFNGLGFNPVGISDFIAMDNPMDEIPPWALEMLVSASFLIFVLPFTGAAMFSKHPLVKTLFSIAIIIAFYVTFIYIIVEPLGLYQYDINESELMLFPDNETSGFILLTFLAIITNLLMLAVAFMKIKEKEV